MIANFKYSEEMYIIVILTLDYTSAHLHLSGYKLLIRLRAHGDILTISILKFIVAFVYVSWCVCLWHLLSTSLNMLFLSGDEMWFGSLREC